MSTITSKPIIDELIASGGYYEDDPRAALIVEYTNAYGEVVWGVTWQHETQQRQRRYLVATFHVRNPRVIWSADGGAQ